MKDYNTYDEESRQALMRFLDLVRKESLEFFVASDEQKKVYEIARKLCEMDGNDPDRISMGNPRCPAMLDAKQTIAIAYPIRPNWMLYISDARQSIDVVEGYKTNV